MAKHQHSSEVTSHSPWTVRNVVQWVEPAVHACRSETALGCTMWEALPQQVKQAKLPHRMGEFRLLYLLCMLRFPVPLHSLQSLGRQSAPLRLCDRRCDKTLDRVGCY
jgi:hypothetical protein